MKQTQILCIALQFPFVISNVSSDWLHAHLKGLAVWVFDGLTFGIEGLVAWQRMSWFEVLFRSFYFPWLVGKLFITTAQILLLKSIEGHFFSDRSKVISRGKNTQLVDIMNWKLQKWNPGMDTFSCTTTKQFIKWHAKPKVKYTNKARGNTPAEINNRDKESGRMFFFFLNINMEL